jgi:hypothetical protein
VRVFCGIGNYLADEILFQARVHPSTKSSNINELDWYRLKGAMSSVLTIAVDANADYHCYPEHWLFHYRWEKAMAKRENIVMKNGDAIVFEETAGRTSAIVPSMLNKQGDYLTETHITQSHSHSHSQSKASVMRTISVKKKSKPKGKNSNTGGSSENTASQDEVVLIAEVASNSNDNINDNIFIIKYEA